MKILFVHSSDLANLRQDALVGVDVFTEQHLSYVDEKTGLPRPVVAFHGLRHDATGLYGKLDVDLAALYQLRHANGDRRHASAVLKQLNQTTPGLSSLTYNSLAAYAQECIGKPFQNNVLQIADNGVATGGQNAGLQLQSGSALYLELTEVGMVDLNRGKGPQMRTDITAVSWQGPLQFVAVSLSAKTATVSALNIFSSGVPASAPIAAPVPAIAAPPPASRAELAVALNDGTPAANPFA